MPLQLPPRQATPALALALLSAAAGAQTATEPYPVTVWASVFFGADGKAAEYRLVDEAKYPAPFAASVKARLERMRVPPSVESGQPATLRTGVRLEFTVAPKAEGGASVKLEGVEMEPLPLKTYYASYPKDVAGSAGWAGTVEGVCTVGTAGRCTAIEVTALPGIPDSVRRFARASLEGWTFEPQQVNGQPVEGQFRMRVTLNTLDDAPEDFRQDKFQRLLKSR